jgi:hypothetical protein
MLKFFMENSPNITVRPVNANHSVLLYAVCCVMCVTQHIYVFYFRSCQDIDECEQFKDHNLCVGICVNQAGSYTCQCPEGYRIGTDGRTCQGILKACITLRVMSKAALRQWQPLGSLVFNFFKHILTI